jgi:signal transduction histidine kinase/tetratricopeptide (TPR) repeat protein
MTPDRDPSGHLWPAFAIGDEAVAELGTEEPPAAGGSCATGLVHRIELAWHLRQRDTERALVMADSIEFSEAAVLALRADLRARLELVRAEADWLSARLEQARRRALHVVDLCRESDDPIGHCDARILLACIAFDVGQFDQARDHLCEAEAWARQAADPRRVDQARVVSFFYLTVGDLGEAERHGVPVATRLLDPGDTMASMWAHEFFGQLHSRRGRHSEAVASFSRAHHIALRLGQLRRAVSAAANVAANWINLNEAEASLEWVERGLSLMPALGWPGSRGVCLMMLGKTQHMLGRVALARQTLEEAIAVLTPLPASITLAGAKACLCEVVLEAGDGRYAAEMADQVLAVARTIGRADLESDSYRLQSLALSSLGRRDEAAAAGRQALEVAERLGSAQRAFYALLALAQVHAAESPPGQPARASLPHLQRAVALAAGIEGFIVPPESLDAAAREHALRGEFAEAFELVQRANALRDVAQAKAADQRAVVLEVHLETARIRAEAQALRDRTDFEARRARQLAAANDVLQRLGAIGSDITSLLDIDAIFGRVYRHLDLPLDLQHLSIWLLDGDVATLRLRFGVENEGPLPPASVALDDGGSGVARCLREGRELQDEPLVDSPDPRAQTAAPRTRSALYGPLRVRDRVIGVLSVQSVRSRAYGERERLLFRNVCAWTAIAIDNAEACSQLDRTREQLQIALDAERRAREQVELATQLKGEFMANISHDLRTPLASLHGYLETLLLKPGLVIDADRERYLAAASALSAKVQRMVHELTELAQLESGAVRPDLQPIDLPALAREVLVKLELDAARREHRLSLRCDPGLPRVLGDIGMIERVLTNLLDNAIAYTPAGSAIVVEVRAVPRGVGVTVVDNGPGIPAELRDALFTRPSQVAQAHRPGGGGLGLLIVQRLLQQHGVEIALVDRPGAGAVFEFELLGWDGP